jgi:4,5-dihydroxyphthalate decarboxylase
MTHVRPPANESSELATMNRSDPPTALRTVLGNYPHTLALKRGEIASPSVRLEFVDVKPTHLAFKPMVRELQFDLCEMAIVTFLMAKAHGKPLALLPAVMLGRFQHHCMLYNAERGALTPHALAGRRVGVRAYSQTTGVWLRGILANDYGVDLDRVRWVTFEDAHVAEYRDPPQIERASGDLTALLLAGEIDAAIFGAELPPDARLESVIPQPEAAAQAWYRKHRVTPVNHLVVVKTALVRSNPQAVAEAYRLLATAKQAALAPAGIDPAPYGIAANRPALELIVDYCLQQRMIPRRFSVDELFAGVGELIGAE